jgi:hypothetical protein
MSTKDPTEPLGHQQDVSAVALCDSEALTYPERSRWYRSEILGVDASVATDSGLEFSNVDRSAV